MKIKSGLITQASGSLGGLTAAHNKGGMYFRARSIPTNPGTAQQSAVRAALADLVARWNDTLSAAQREAWEDYAAAVDLTDTLGEPRTVTALNMYLRTNVIGLQSGLSPIDTAPSVMNLGGPGDFDDSQTGIDATDDEIDLHFFSGDDWVSEDDAHMFVFASRPVNPSINFFKGPYRLAGKIDGDSSTPPTSPTVLGLPFPVVAGQKVFIQTRVRRADGRLTAPFRGGFLAA